MPPLTRWFVRTALIYLVIALLTGCDLMLRFFLDLPPVGAAAGLGGPPWLLPLGRLAGALAVLLFARHAWPRVKPLGM